MIRIKEGVKILDLLNKEGYTTYRLRHQRIFGERAVQKFRHNGLPSWNELDRLCGLLHCDPWDLIERVEGDDGYSDED